MRLCDMHCDTLTFCADRRANLRSNFFQADLERLYAAGYSVQCFAVFTRNCSEEKFNCYADYFGSQIEECPDIAVKALSYSDILYAENLKKTACVLTAENLGFFNPAGCKALPRAEDCVERLYSKGVRMASLVWNDYNGLAYPNLVFRGGAPSFSERETRGLTYFGREIAEALDEKNIIIDVSHLSDGGLAELLKERKKPLVASHSDAYALHPVSRNLTDMQIKAIADCGGIIGVNYCLDFLGAENAFEGAVKHINHIIKTGGEECAALGSDFDGMDVQKGMEDCSKAALLAERLSEELGARVAEKVCGGNFMRVFGEVVG